MPSSFFQDFGSKQAIRRSFSSPMTVQSSHNMVNSIRSSVALILHVLYTITSDMSPHIIEQNRIAEVGKDLLDHQVQSYHRITEQEVRKWKLGKEFSFVMWEWLCLSLFIKSFEILNVKSFTVLKMQFSNAQCLFNLNSVSLQVLMKFPPFILCSPVLETCCFSPIRGTKKYHRGL